MDEDVNKVKGSNTPCENNTSDTDFDKDEDEIQVVGTKNVVKMNGSPKKTASDGNHNELVQKPKQSVKSDSKKSPVPRIIANNFKSSKTSKLTDEEANQSQDINEPAPEMTKAKEDCDERPQEITNSSERGSDIQGLRLKPSKELLTQSDKRDGKVPSNDRPTDINSNKSKLDSSSSKDKINKLRSIRPKLGSNLQFRRSNSNDSSTSKMSDITLKRKSSSNEKDADGVELNKNNCFWEHKLLNYLSPRLNHPRSHTTNSQPISSKESSTGKNFGSCPIWIHLLVGSNMISLFIFF